jgi:hypothetical protein
MNSRIRFFTSNVGLLHLTAVADREWLVEASDKRKRSVQRQDEAAGVKFISRTSRPSRNFPHTSQEPAIQWPSPVHAVLPACFR